MRSINRVTLLGHLGADPDVKVTSNNNNLAVFNVATNQKWKDSDGNWQERTEWHRIVCWEKMADIAGKKLKKGDPVYIEGLLTTRSWEDKDGQKHYVTEVVAKDLIPMNGN
jgi:single-strand DNA-binding protein